MNQAIDPGLPGFLEALTGSIKAKTIRISEASNSGRCRAVRLVVAFGQKWAQPCRAGRPRLAVLFTGNQVCDDDRSFSNSTGAVRPGPKR